VVCDSDKTISQWLEHHDEIDFCKRALAVQNGMTPEQVKTLPVQPDVIFVGGARNWKFETLSDWCKHFDRVHVGRVNGVQKSIECQALGAESVDGTGWFRHPDNLSELERLLRILSKND